MTVSTFDPSDAPEDVVTTLQAKGVAIVRDLIVGDELDRLAADLRRILDESAVGDHEYLGLATRRTGRLLAKTRHADRLATDPFVLAVLEGLLGEVQLTAPSAIELLPGEEAGWWHYDDRFYPLGRPHPDVVCNVLVAIDPFTEANGATRVAIGSNQWRVPRDPRPSDRVIVAEMDAGSAVLMTGATTHSAGANTTDRSRVGLAMEYASAWLRPQETLTLSVPPSIAVGLPPRLQQLLGYGATAEGLGHVGGLPPSVVLDELTESCA
jgi:ectoine hydroxylase-related dioxygenase (phytanoyl-CoA dioxygenase family)